MQSKRKQADLKFRSVFDPIAMSDACNLTKIHRNKIWSFIMKSIQIDIDAKILESSTSSSSAPTNLFNLKDVPMEDSTFSVKKSDIRVLKAEESPFVAFTSRIVETVGNSRQDTTKLLIELQDGHQIESVIIRHQHYSTLCVSSQIGCAMGCKFCATGTMGIIGDLTAGEIIEQYVMANTITPIRNVVFMGMGEPLNNYENVKAAISCLIDPGSVFSLSPRHVTVSTVGVIKNMYKLTKDLPYVNLALSLHAPDQETRLKIVPTAGANKIETLMDGVDNHIRNSKRSHKHGRKLTVMMEYILIKDVNDTIWHAHALGKLLHERKKDILLNLIPYNPTAAGDSEGYLQPENTQIDAFFGVLTKDEFGYNLFTRLRHEMGQDVDAACGQLAVSRQDTSKNPGARDIEDFNKISSPSSSGGYIMTYFHDVLGGLMKMVDTRDNPTENDEDTALNGKEKRNERGSGVSSDSMSRTAQTDGTDGTDGTTMVAASAVLTGFLLASIVVYRAAKTYRAS